ncbi:uncharacterized protein [Apostichopus japonicus]|uniref:uncharacterized protein isoform X5 n=1 Tax=Stichopus japonicus TaxID=307972 RepID=UPI003AB4B4EE
MKNKTCFIPVRWLILFMCVSSIPWFAETQDLDEVFALPDSVDPNPDDPNDANACVYQGKEYFHTERWVVDECSRCYCNNGTTNCVYETCPTLTCDFFEQVKIDGECCKKCPPEMVVSRVEGVLLKDDPIIEGKNQEVTFDVGIEINKQSTSRNVNGENLWSMGAWISKNFDGTGSRLFYNENVLSQEQQDSSFSKPNYPPWQFANLTLDLQGRRRGLCEDFKYLCVKFNKGDEIQTEFNLDFSFGPQNGDDTRLVACALLPECKGVVIDDFDWSIEPREGREVSLDLDVDFREDTRDLEGTSLWQSTLYGSDNEEGTGDKFGEVTQILNREQASKSIQNAEQLQLRDIRTEFDLSMIGCTPDATYVCLELRKGLNSQPDFTLEFLGEYGQIVEKESSVKCVARQCGARAVFTELVPEIVSPRALIENTPGQTVKLNIDAVTDKLLSTTVEGTRLWQMNVFFSKKQSGFGQRIDEQLYVLDPVKQMQTLTVGEDLFFEDVVFEVDLSRLVCSDIPYMCTELNKNPSSSIDYEFGTKPKQDPFVGCLDMSSVCRGIIAKNLEWEGEFPSFIDGPIEPVQSIVSNASVDVESVSRDVTGDSLWQMSVFASSTAEAAPEDILPPYFEQILTDEQSGLPVPEDGILRFYNMETPPFQVDRMGCGKYRFLCYEFKKAENTDTEFTFNEEAGGKTVLNCQEMSCQAVTPDNLNWAISAENPQPERKTDVTLNVTVNLREDTRDISGARLWRLGLFGSMSQNGTGQKFDEVYQVLSDEGMSKPVINQMPVEFGTFTTQFEIGTIGCVEGLDYVCIELTKNADPEPDYVMLIERNGGFDAKSLVSCKPQECSAKVVFDELSASFPNSTMIVEAQPNQRITVSLDGVTDKAKSSFVSGENLWSVATYFSDKRSGKGIRIREQTQILDQEEISQTLRKNENLLFAEVEFPIDLSHVQCATIPYVCFELRKNPESSVNFKFKPEPQKEPLVDCKSTDDLCKGVVARFLTWSPDGEDREHVPGELSPIIGDVTVDLVPASRDVAGNRLWKLSAFASSDSNGDNQVGPRFRQVLSTSQAKTPVEDGGPLIFRNVVTPPYPIDLLGCGDYKHFCLELRKSEVSDPDFSFETTDGADTVKQCVEYNCDAIFFDDLSWELTHEPVIPGQLSPVVLDIVADFGDQSKTLDGENLWQVSLFGSTTPTGDGVRYGEVPQILSEDQASIPVTKEYSITFNDTDALFDIGSIGCNEFSHICIALKKAEKPSVNFTLIMPSTSDALPEQSVVNCKPKDCNARVFFTDLEPSINEPDIFVENSKKERVSTTIFAPTDKDRSTSVGGDELWQLNTFFSDQDDGLGERIYETRQVLDDSQASLTLNHGDDLMFNETIFDVDLDVTCDQIPFVCYELTKNPESSINYQFGGDVLKCIDISSRCKGVVFTGLDFEYSVPDDVSFGPLSIDAVASTEPYSRAVSGEDLWKLEVFASSDPEGKIKTDSFLKKSLGTTLPKGGPIQLSDIITEKVDTRQLGCGYLNYMCVKFSRGRGEEPVFTLEMPSGGGSMVTCKQMNCSEVSGSFDNFLSCSQRQNQDIVER